MSGGGTWRSRWSWVGQKWFSAGQCRSAAGQQGSGTVPLLVRSLVQTEERTAPPPRRPADGWRKGAPPIPGPGLSVESPSATPGRRLPCFQTLDEVAERIRTTHCCALCPARINAVPGYGNPNARLVLVGEGPGGNGGCAGQAVRWSGRKSPQRDSRGHRSAARPRYM